MSKQACHMVRAIGKVECNLPAVHGLKTCRECAENIIEEFIGLWQQFCSNFPQTSEFSIFRDLSGFINLHDKEGKRFFSKEMRAKEMFFMLLPHDPFETLWNDKLHSRLVGSSEGVKEICRRAYEAGKETK